MADDDSRVLQAMIAAAAEITNRSPSIEQSSVSETTGESEIGLEPTSEEDEEISHAFLEQLLASGDDDDEYEDVEDDDDEGTEHAYGGEIEVEIEEPAEILTPEEAERRAAQRRSVIRLLQNTDVGRLFRFATNGRMIDEDDDDDDIDLNVRWRRSRRPRPDPNRFPVVPSEEGTLLMNSGAFGSNEAQAVTADDVQNITKKKKLAMRILDRELAIESPAKRRLNNRLMAQDMLPASQADMIIHYDLPVYSGQFSDDGNFFFSANKDYKVRMYDTSNPYKWRYYKTVEYPFGQWTLTDASLSPDNKYLAYTSIKSTVCLAPTDPQDQGDPYILELSDRGDGRGNARQRFGNSFGIWSIRYSGDGQKLVAGTTGGSIVLYDIESRRSLHRIFGHDEDVNAVCFADKLSPHILYSGSDDTILKVWDTRSMSDSRAAGAFVGHIEGITYIDSKGDGRYVLSNGKDQSMKLWDLRMVMPSGEFERIKPQRRATHGQHFDYRWGAYDEDDWYKDQFDNSVVTFRGHKVLRTLIRCHFSPAASTNSRYVYSGSEDGKVYIWNMDATLAGTVDVRAATTNSRPRRRFNPGLGWEDEDGEEFSNSRWKTCVRDVAWHPNAPMIVASAWNGYGMTTGTCTVHSWNDGAETDEGEMGVRVDQQLKADPEFYRQSEPTTHARRRPTIWDN